MFSVESLKDNISAYYKNKLSPIQNAEQHLILDEFLKYTKLADANFELTQAINYDTARIKNADDLARKQMKTKSAERTGLLSSPSKIMSSSFLGTEERMLDKSTDALGTILKFNSPEFRDVLDQAIEEYASGYLSNDTFNQVAEKLSASFLDYVIQTNLNTLNVNELLQSADSVAIRLEKAKAQYPGVKILQDLVVVSSETPNGPKSIKLRVNAKEAYDQNLYIGMMREMRDNPSTANLFKDIVKLAIVQGTYQSAVSIKNVVPIEDYADIVTPIVSAVSVTPSIRNFAKDNWFQRNNWNDSNIVPRISPNINEENTTFVGEDVTGNEVFQYEFTGFQPIPGQKESVLVLSPYSKGSNSDVIAIPRIFNMNGEMIDFVTGKTVTKTQYRQRKAKGDLTLKEVYGYQKVKFSDGTPLTNYKGNFVYKQINLYGDGALASEYHDNFAPSQLNNNTAKVETEIPNADIIKFFTGSEEKNVSLNNAETISKEAASKLNFKKGPCK